MNRREMMAGLGRAGLGVAGQAIAATDEDAATKAPAGPRELSVAEARTLLLQDGHNPVNLYGCKIQFIGTIMAIDKGANGGRTVRVSIDEWSSNREYELYGTAIVHNPHVGRDAKAGDRLKFSCLIV